MSKTCWTTSLDSIFLKYYKHLSALWLWIFGAVKSELELQMAMQGAQPIGPTTFDGDVPWAMRKPHSAVCPASLLAVTPTSDPKPLSDPRGLQFFENLQ